VISVTPTTGHFYILLLLLYTYPKNFSPVANEISKFRSKFVKKIKKSKSKKIVKVMTAFLFRVGPGRGSQV